VLLKIVNKILLNEIKAKDRKIEDS